MGETLTREQLQVFCKRWQDDAMLVVLWATIQRLEAENVRLRAETVQLQAVVRFLRRRVADAS